MSTKEHDAWLQSVLGINRAKYAKAAAPTARAGATPSAQAAPAAPSGAAAPAGVAAVITAINDTLTELDAQSKRLKDDGIPAQPLDAQIAKLQSRLAALGKSTTVTKQLTALRTDAAETLKAVKGDADRQADSLSAGSDKAIQDLRDAAAAQIDRLDAGNPKKADLAQKLKDLDAQIKAAQTATDAAKQAAARQAADKAAQDLIQAAADAGGSSKEAKKAVQQAYKKALEEKYGITIGKRDNFVTEHTQFDKVYKMFEQVPIAHVVHEKLKDLSFDKTLAVGKDKHGIGRYSGAGIQLGDYYDERNWPYTNPNTGKAEKPNGFSISVLHELGHSVDKRWGIMEKYEGEKGCGGWNWHNAKGLAQDLAADFIRGAGADAMPKAAVTEVVHTALATGAAGTAPDGTDPAAFAKLQAYLAPWIKVRNATAYTVTHAFGERTYFARGGESWMSYLTSAHAAMRVTDYQWSAPAEWFAELYAICWYKGEAAPAGVHEGVRAYMPQKGGGGPGAPSAPG